MAFVRRHFRALVALLLVSALVAIAPDLIIHALAAPYTYANSDDVPPGQAAIVLGASVVGGVPSPVLADRADAAVELYLKGKVAKILVTGDNGALSHDEVTPVRKYLLDSGIPGQDIFLDHAGFDTYSSMYRARAIFGLASTTIVTQNFHLPRAIFLARALGLDAYGVVAAGGGSDFFDYLREIPASWKALVDLALRRTPKYLGPAIPITGDGQTTWY